MGYTDNYILKRAKVLSVKDDLDGLRIKVRLYPEDNLTTDDNDLPYCFPLLPKMVHVNPKEGESVLIILAKQDDPKGDRYFFGPIIAQPQNLDFAASDSGAYTLMNGSIVSPQEAPSNNPENEGSFPERDDVSLRGRENTDIILKTNEIRIRCGIHKNGSNKLAFNNKNIGYIQMKYINGIEHKGKSFNSVTNIVSDKINLLSYQSIDGFKMTDNKSLITDEQLIEILNKAHLLPYGDILIEFLDKFLKAFINHTHNFPGNPTLPTEEVKSVSNYDLNKILCKSIRIS